MSHNETESNNASSTPGVRPSQIQLESLSSPPHVQDTSHGYPIPQDSFARRPRRIFSLISRFEGLHNLNFQRKGIPPTQQEPLDRCSGSPRFRGGIYGSQIKKLARIFGPAKESLEIQGKIVSGKSLVQEREEVFTSHDGAVTQASGERLYISGVLSSSSNNDKTPKVIVSASREFAVGSTRRHTSTNDNVEYYNGEIPSPNVIRAKPIFGDIAITSTSLPRSKSGCDKGYPLGCKRYSADPISRYISTVPTHGALPRIQNLTCNDAWIQHFFTQTPRPGVSTRATASANLGDATQRSGRVAIRANDTPFRRSSGSRNRIRAGPVWDLRDRPLATRGRQIQRRFGDVEESHQVKISERRLENILESSESRVAEPLLESKRTKLDLNHGNVMAENNQEGAVAADKPSKVAETKKMLENRRRVQPRSLRLPTNDSLMNPSRISAAPSKTIIDDQLLPVPLAPPDAPRLSRQEISSVPPRKIFSEISAPHGQQSMNNFYNIQGVSERRRQGNNILGLSSGRTSEAYRDIPERPLRKKDKQADRNGMEDRLSRDTVGKHGNWAPKLSLDQMVEIVNSTPQHNDNFGSPTPRAEMGGMIVKKAQCGLTQPKPMRMVERRRIMLLCRDKAWCHADKENMKVGQLREL
ncbi:uncharacterized protein BP5553_03467 [Venustampulla echinocandica]|uniref:Uncharacterized protein n=1 Tax=Venustampulla echinocandica TaxID=2656787 RepID=A0A370TUB8_9HELO|nr:uncharacterized protein BP5553_03467 [Venustampulla echinocandica]RDL39127.1 hypothetical protein BP5553_03467 [Venustampulla echinocandica]